MHLNYLIESRHWKLTHPKKSKYALEATLVKMLTPQPTQRTHRKKTSFHFETVPPWATQFGSGEDRTVCSSHSGPTQILTSMRIFFQISNSRRCQNHVSRPSVAISTSHQSPREAYEQCLSYDCQSNVQLQDSSTQSITILFIYTSQLN